MRPSKSRLLSLSSFLSLCCLILAMLPVLSQAKDDPAVPAIRALFNRTQPDIVIADIKPSVIAGLYEVQTQGGQTVYVSSDAKYLIPGDLYEARKDGLTNLGESRRNQLRLDKIARIDEKDMIIFAAKGERKATLTVFTDVDCPYCRKLHSEIDELNHLGITVRYLAYPRTGLSGETYEKMISTWCASDRKATFTSAKLGNDIPLAKCDSSVIDKEYDLGNEVGVTGTPALVFEDGTLLPGYAPAATLASYMLDDAAK